MTNNHGLCERQRLLFCSGKKIRAMYYQEGLCSSSNLPVAGSFLAFAETLEGIEAAPIGMSSEMDGCPWNICRNFYILISLNFTFFSPILFNLAHDSSLGRLKYCSFYDLIQIQVPFVKVIRYLIVPISSVLLRTSHIPLMKVRRLQQSLDSILHIYNLLLDMSYMKCHKIPQSIISQHFVDDSCHALKFNYTEVNRLSLF